MLSEGGATVEDCTIEMARRRSADGWTTSAISPGMITRKGKNILGNAAMSGVRRAAVIDSAAMARWTTRKSVHQ